MRIGEGVFWNRFEWWPQIQTSRRDRERVIDGVFVVRSDGMLSEAVVEASCGANKRVGHGDGWR